MSGLNHVLLICMGSSFGVDAINGMVWYLHEFFFVVATSPNAFLDVIQKTYCNI
jgi:hypothetical protein